MKRTFLPVFLLLVFLCLFSCKKEVTCTVSFDSNGGAEVTSMKVSQGGTITLPAATREHYTFDGWCVAGSTTPLESSTFIVIQDTTLSAKWTGKKSTVTFAVGNEGVITETTKGETYGDAYALPVEVPTTTKEHYEFKGWYKEESYENLVTDSTIVDTDTNHTLYAKWGLVTYTVTFVAEGGTETASQRVEYNATASVPTSPARENYTFKEWIMTENNIVVAYDFQSKVTKDITLKASWTGVDCTVSFYNRIPFSSTTTADDTKTVEYGKSITAIITPPSKDNYVFLGWQDGDGKEYDFTKTVTGNINLYGHWRYPVFYYKNTPSESGLSIGSGVSTVVNQDGSDSDYTSPAGETKNTILDLSGATITAPESYRFSGWNTMSDGSGTTYNVNDTGRDGALHLFAQWSCIRYDSNYIQVGISTSAGVKTYKQSDDKIIKDVYDSSLGYSVEGYVFNGWKDSVGNVYKVGDTYAEDGVLTLYAQWACIRYYGNYSLVGGTDPESYKSLADTTIKDTNDSSLGYSVDGYGCSGWKDSDGNFYKIGDTYEGSGVLNLYAQWAFIRYYGNYSLVGGMDPETYKQSGNLTIADASSLGYSVEGYAFDGWKDSDGKVYKIGDTYEGNGVLTLYAQWNNSWTTVGREGFSGNAVSRCSLALNSNGVPYLAYCDAANNNKATVMKYGSFGWNVVGTAGFSDDAVNYCSLAIDSKNVPYLAFSDYRKSGKATVMQYDGTKWTFVGNPGFSAGRSDRCSLAIDSKDNLYLAYSDGGNSNKATMMKYDGTKWIVVGAAGFSAYAVWYSSLAIDSKNVPYLAYRYWEKDKKTAVMKYDGTKWIAVGNVEFSAGKDAWCSLAIDSNDTPYFAFQDEANSFKATVMKYDGSNWNAVGSAGFSAGGVEYCSLAIYSKDNLCLAYRDGGNNNKATVMKFDGTNWVSVGDVGFSAGEAWYCSLAIDSNGKPYLAYSDGGNSNKATVMTFPDSL